MPVGNSAAVSGVGTSAVPFDQLNEAAGGGARNLLTGATSRRGAERRVLKQAWPVLDQLDAAVEGPVLDHFEGDVRVAVVDAFCARGP